MLNPLAHELTSLVATAHVTVKLASGSVLTGCQLPFLSDHFSRMAFKGFTLLCAVAIPLQVVLPLVEVQLVWPYQTTLWPWW